MNNKYIKVDVLKYVKKGLEDGILQPIIAEKFSRIVAIQGHVGEEVISWSVDSNGNAVQEKIAMVELDKITNEPGWIVSKVDENGQIIFDKNGKVNQWIIADSLFKRKYELVDNELNMYKPVGGPQIFVQIPDNLILNQWGADMKIAMGGYINITNINDLYGISERDFIDTYKCIDAQVKKN